MEHQQDEHVFCFFDVYVVLVPDIFPWRAMFFVFFPAWLCGFFGFCGCVAFVALACFTYLST